MKDHNLQETVQVDLVPAVVKLSQSEIEHNAWVALDDELMCSMIWKNPQTRAEWKAQLRELIEWEISLYQYFEDQKKKTNDK